MEYKLYTLVDITNTGQHRFEEGREEARWREQNFQTVLQTLGIRSNISFIHKPEMIELRGRLAGFDTDEVIRVWRFDWNTERDYLYEKAGDPVGYLKDDFHLVPYIANLSEMMQQKFAVFNTKQDRPNIVFHQK
jgi:hypothetical protein